MKRIICITIFVFTQCLIAQEVIQLIGLDVDNSEFAKNSYGAMYDSKNPKNKTSYTPYKTLGIYRKGNSVEIQQLDYLVVPTKTGFKYATLQVVEKKLEEKAYQDYDIRQEALESYKLASSVTNPIFFNSKNKIESFIQQSAPSFADALEVNFQRISFINHNFYTTVGFESQVHGGASWFNAHEIMNIYPIDWKSKKISNRVLDYLSNTVKNEIVISTVDTLDYGYSDQKTNEYTMLPWSSSIGSFKDVFFDFYFEGNGLSIYPFTRLQGNSSRAFFAKGKRIETIKLYNDFNLKKSKNKTDITFISPDNSTKTVIKKRKILVFDTESNTLLKSVNIGFNKLIMSEYAIGKYAGKWKSEFN